MAREEISDLKAKMAKFHDEICCNCDNELCYSIYDERGRDVCIFISNGILTWPIGPRIKNQVC